jgi:hypothetical protein
MHGVYETSRQPVLARDAEDDTDGCLCNIKFDDLDAVDDRDLPAAAGGVGIIADAGGDDGGESKGADFQFSDLDMTPDEDLPPAAGGILSPAP